MLSWIFLGFALVAWSSAFWFDATFYIFLIGLLFYATSVALNSEGLNKNPFDLPVLWTRLRGQEKEYRSEDNDGKNEK